MQVELSSWSLDSRRSQTGSCSFGDWVVAGGGAVAGAVAAGLTCRVP